MSTQVMRNHGRTFPPELLLGEREARRGTAVIRHIDPDLVVGFNKRRGLYEIWGPSSSLCGWTHCCDVADDQGQPYRGQVPWVKVAASIQEARDSQLTAAERVFIHNERLRAQMAETAREERMATANYCRDAIRAEWEGASRHSTRDVMQGLKMAKEGGTKAEPVGQKFSLPGEAVK